MLSIHNRIAFALLASLAAIPAAGAVGCVADAQDAGSEDVADEDTGEAEEAMLSSSNNEGFGFVWSTLATTGTVNANASYSYNSAGGVNTITNSGTGLYRVDFPSLGDVGGNVQVTSYGSSSDRCKVQSWGGSPTLSVYVRCHTVGGALVNTPFVVYYGREKNAYHGAYLWNDQASAALNAAYTPSTAYQYTQGSAYSTITRLNPGVYRVRVPGASPFGTTVHVTAYGAGPEYCNVDGWASSGSDTIIDVSCFGLVGASADSLFSLSFHRGSPSTGKVGGFALANDSVSSSYTPNASYSGLYNTYYPCYYGSGITAGHNAPTGSYFVRYPSMAGYNSTAMVTSYGYSNTYCKVTSWGGIGSDAQVNVQCYDYLGSPVNTTFTSTYLGTEMFTPC